jgi:hypothetical protein
MEKKVGKKSLEELGIDDDFQMRIASKLKPEDKQSKRTTFRLTRESSDNLKSWARETGTTIKEQFELLANLYEFLKEEVKKTNEGDTFDFKKGTGSLDLSVRKTYVISKKTFKLINEESKRLRVSRDIFIEKLIRIFQIFQEFNANRLKESKEKHSEAYAILKGFSEKVDQIEKDLRKLLSSDDPILIRFEIVEVIMTNLLSDIEEELGGGKPVDPGEWA